MTDGIYPNTVETPPWVRENMGWTHEQAEAFKDKVARIGNRSKLADMAAANLSGCRLLDKKDESHSP